MKQLYKIMALFLLLAVAGGQCGYAQSGSTYHPGKIQSGDTVVCFGDTVHQLVIHSLSAPSVDLNSSPSFKYRWKRNKTIIDSSNTANYTISGLMVDTDYTFVRQSRLVNSTDWHNDSGRYTIRVRMLPTVKITGDSVTCQGDSTRLTASGTQTYLWSTGDSDTTITVYSTGIYKVRGQDSLGCASTDTMTVTVNHPTHSSTTIDTCESYTWTEGDSLTYTTSGNYTYSHSDANGCTQVDTLHLTIHHGTHTAQTASMCGSYFWHGTTYTTDTIATYEYTSADGCSCVDTLHLTINNPKDSAFYKTACESYVWTDGTGETYTSSGTYLHPHLDAHGCWQVDTLHLTINHTTYGDTTVVACEFFTWHGIPYTETPAIAPTYTIVDGNHNGCDSIVTLHLAIHHGTHNVFIVDTCESYTWHGQTYTASGNYTYPYNNEYGCPSVDTLYLTINNPVHTSITRSACGGYEWHETIYTESGDYFFSHSDVNGCTQVDTLHLTINNPVHLATTVTTCESYTWNGTLYTVSDEYTYAHLDAHGCWQVDTLHLTINSAYHTDLHVSACETYTWNGQTYTESGDYDQTFTAANGCDSLVTLHLTINNPIHTAITRNACGSYDWHDSTYTESGDYFFSHSDVNGCTQVDTLHLTINNPVHADTTVVACGSYTWNGTLYTVSGDYTYAHLDAHGCWQVDTLHLTINHATYGDTIVVVCESFTWHGTTYTETPAIAPTYTIVGGNHNGCDSIVTLTLTVHPLPTPFITGDNEICSYDTTTLVAGGGIVYTWSTGESNNQIQVSETGTYYVTVTDVNGCSNTTHIVVSLAPTDTSLSDAIVTKSHDGVPYMLIYPKANLLYQWYENGVAVPDETRQYYAPNGGLQKHICYKVLARPLDDKCGVLTKCWELTDTSTTKVRILPNPNNGQFRLLLPEGTVQVQILDANGQTVLARKTDGATELDMNTGLANGLYFVKIFRQDGSFNTEKLVINR